MQFTEDTILSLSGTTSSEIALPGFSCFDISQMELSASGIITSSGFKVKDISLSGGAVGCGLGNANAHFTYDSELRNTTISIMIAALDLPSPFASTSTTIAATLTRQGTDNGFYARLESSITLPVLQNPLGISMGIFITQNLQATQITLSAESDLQQTVTFSQFPAFSLKDLKVHGSITVNPNGPLTLTAVNLTGSVSVANYSASGSFLYDSVSKGIGLLISMPSIDLQVHISNWWIFRYHTYNQFHIIHNDGDTHEAIYRPCV